MVGAPPAEPPTRSGHLLLVCALGVESLALRRGRPPRRSPAAGGPPAMVLRTGMGPRAARAAVARALRAEADAVGAREAGETSGRRPPGPAARLGRRIGVRRPTPPVVPPAAGPDERAPGMPTAVVVTGFCAGLLPDMRPGDLVVADETVTDDTGDPDGRTRCTGFQRLVEALAPTTGEGDREPGHPARPRRVYTGPLVGTDHLVRGWEERARLRATGAVAADMESAAVLTTARAYGVPQVAAVRVVVDAPGHELIRFRTLRGGVSAFRALSAVCPILYEWHRP